jgi:exonuclease-1
MPSLEGAYSCALELGTGNKYWERQKRDAPYVRYCIHRAQMLRHFGITPVIVFDGDRLPAKGMVCHRLPTKSWDAI